MKKTLFSTLLLAAAFSASAQSPGFAWAKQLSGTGDETPVDIALDASGNIYHAGYFDGIVDCDPGPGTFTLNSNGADAAYVSKMDAQGNFLWAKQFSGSSQLGGAKDTRATGMVLGPAGEVYVTGYFEGLVDFDPSGSLALLYAGNSGSNAFICKLDAQGNFVWAKHVGGQSADLANGIALDAQSNVYVTGFFQDLANFDPASSATLTTVNGLIESFVLKLDLSGNFVWVRQLVSSMGSVGTNIAVDASGNVYSTGSFNNSCDFDPGPGTFQLGSSGAQEAYLWKLDGSGTFMWARYLGGPTVDGGNAVKVDASGNVIIGGFFTGTFDLDPSPASQTVTSAGNYDLFISKFDAQGNLVWGKTAGGIGNDVIGGLSLGANGDVFCTGYFQNTVDFDPGAGVYNLTAAGRDIMIFKLNASGNFAWARQLSGNGLSGGSAITNDATGSVYSTGSFSTTVDFDPGAGSFSLTAFAQTDAYIHKMECGNAGVTVTGTSTLICAGSSATLSASGALTYTWNGTPGSNLVISPSVTTTYSVNGTDANGCSVSASVTQSVTTCTGLGELSSENVNLLVYPNPGKGQVTVEIPVTTAGTLQLHLRNALGQVVMQQQVEAQNRLNTEALPAGIYFLQLVQSGTTLGTQKLVIAE